MQYIFHWLTLKPLTAVSTLPGFFSEWEEGFRWTHSQCSHVFILLAPAAAMPWEWSRLQPAHQSRQGSGFCVRLARFVEGVQMLQNQKNRSAGLLRSSLCQLRGFWKLCIYTSFMIPAGWLAGMHLSPVFIRAAESELELNTLETKDLKL